MPKTVYTPRDELICGKLDVADTMAAKLGSAELCELLMDIRHDALRMEAKLITRKQEANEANTMTPPYTPDTFFAWAESRGFVYSGLQCSENLATATVAGVGYFQRTYGKTPAEAIRKLMDGEAMRKLMEMKHEHIIAR